MSGRPRQPLEQPVSPVFRTEAEAFVGQALPVASLHFLREWIPRIGRTAALVLLELRAEVMASGATGAAAPMCEISQDELGRRLDADKKTIRRAVTALVRAGFVTVVPQRRHSLTLGHPIVATHRYRVLMYDPPVPGSGGEGAVLARQAERVLREGDVLPGDRAGRSDDCGGGTPTPRSPVDPAAYRSGGRDSVQTGGATPTPAPLSGGRDSPQGGPLWRRGSPTALAVPKEQHQWGPETPADSKGVAPQQELVVAVSPKELNKQQTEVAELLASCGVPIERATSLAATYDARRIRDQVRRLKARITESSAAVGIANPVGYLIRAIEQNYGAPVAGPVLTERLRPTPPPAAVPSQPDPEPSRLRAMFEALPPDRRQAIWDAATAEVRHKFGLRSAPEPLVWACVYERLESAAVEGSPSAEVSVWTRLSGLQDQAEDIGPRLMAWAVKEGLVPTGEARTRDAAKARATLWVVLKRLGLGQRRIAGLCRVDRTTVREALRLAAADGTLESAAAEWARRFLDAWEVFG